MRSIRFWLAVQKPDPDHQRRSQTYLALALVAALFSARATLAMIVVPRWQGPDEPQHFLLIATQAHAGAHDGRAPAGLEAEIIRSMARHGWWTYYDAETPAEPLPTTFSSGPGLITDVHGMPGGSRLYAVAMAPLIRAIGNGVERQYDVLRTLSAFWGVLTVLIAYAATKPWLGTAGAIAVSGTLASHPQFVLVATTVSPDAFVNLCGAAAWWMGVRALSGGRVVESIAALWVAAVAGALTRRVGIPLIGVAAMISVLLLYRVRHIRAMHLQIVAATAIVVAGTFFSMWLISPDDLVRIARNLYEIVRYPIPRPTPDMGRFWWGFWQSAWLYAGWLRLPPPEWWMLGVSAWTVAALGGAAMVFRRDAHRALLGCSLGAVLVQITIIFVSYFWIVGTGAQGRYLFPVLIPFMSLLVVGTRAIAENVIGRRSFAYAVVLMTMFDLLGWTFVLIPSYA